MVAQGFFDLSLNLRIVSSAPIPCPVRMQVRLTLTKNKLSTPAHREGDFEQQFPLLLSDKGGSNYFIIQNTVYEFGRVQLAPTTRCTIHAFMLLSAKGQELERKIPLFLGKVLIVKSCSCYFASTELLMVSQLYTILSYWRQGA